MRRPAPAGLLCSGIRAITQTSVWECVSYLRARFLNQTCPRRFPGRRRTRRLPELAEDVRDMAVDRVLAEDQRGRDLAVVQAGGDEAQHLGLTLGLSGESPFDATGTASSRNPARAR